MSGHTTGSFTQLEEKDIDLRVSGLPHAVVKEAENFRVREFVKKMQILIDPSLQDKVIIPDDFFKYIYHVGCAINLHFIINSGLVPGGQNSSIRQTVFFLPVDHMDKSHKDPKVMDLNVPRHAQYLHNIRTQYIGLILILRFGKD